MATTATAHSADCLPPTTDPCACAAWVWSNVDAEVFGRLLLQKPASGAWYVFVTDGPAHALPRKKTYEFKDILRAAGLEYSKRLGFDNVAGWGREASEEELQQHRQAQARAQAQARPLASINLDKAPGAADPAGCLRWIQANVKHGYFDWEWRKHPETGVVHIFVVDGHGRHIRRKKKTFEHRATMKAAGLRFSKHLGFGEGIKGWGRVATPDEVALEHGWHSPESLPDKPGVVYRGTYYPEGGYEGPYALRQRFGPRWHSNGMDHNYTGD